MADLVDGASDWQKRYGVIESAYCEGRWGTVMESGTDLLRDLLDAGGDPEVKALRHRMQLLMAHTLLHGYGDRDAAEDLYEVVRSSDAEPTLRQMAEDGLDLCHQPLPSTLALEEDGEDGNGEASPPDLFLPDAERIDLEGEEATSDGAESSRDRSPASQMPLQPRPRIRSQPTPEEASAPDDSPEPEVDPPQAPIPPDNPATDLGVAEDPFGPVNGVPLPLQEQTLPVMPWRTEPSPGSGAQGEEEGAWLNQSVGETVTANVVADVVEEPELIELHQSTPSLAEDVDLLIREDVRPQPPSPGEGESDEDGDLRTGLLLVVVG